MPYKDPEKAKEAKRKWRENNTEYMRIYRYNLVKENPHITRIDGWKQQGIKLKPNEDWESVYLFYITCEKCEECAIDLTDENYFNSSLFRPRPRHWIY